MLMENVRFLTVCPRRRAHTLSNTLKAVLMLTRHGDRAPSTQYPNDPHKDYEWPGGIGALSPRGEQQMTQSGAIKAARYSSLMSHGNARNFDNISVLSSCVQRCVDTSKSFLNGFLASTQWPEDLVNIIPFEEDEFLVIGGKSCPAFETTLFEGCSFDQPDVVDFIKSKQLNDDFFKLVEKESGMPLSSLINILLLDDILSIQQDNGLTVPAWVAPIYKDQIRPIADLAFDKMGTSKYLQIRSGALLKDMVQRLDEYVANDTNKNIVLYSAHDLTISSLMYHLDIIGQGDKRPAYGSCFAIELHKSCKSSDDYEIKLFYFRDYADETPVQIALPRLAGQCSFKKFKELMEPKFTVDYESVCREDINECK